MNAKKIALWGMMGALALTVSFIESCFELPFLPPGAKLGLANIITMAAAACWGWGGAYILPLSNPYSPFLPAAQRHSCSAPPAV